MLINKRLKIIIEIEKWFYFNGIFVSWYIIMEEFIIIGVNKINGIFYYKCIRCKIWRCILNLIIKYFILIVSLIFVNILF